MWKHSLRVVTLLFCMVLFIIPLGGLDRTVAAPREVDRLNIAALIGSGG
jgi:hypothetical protein